MTKIKKMSIMIANRSRRALPVMATAIMLLASQNADAQFLKKLGNAVKNAGKEVLESAKTQTPTNQTQANQASTNKSQTSQSDNQQKPRYELHKTAETKTMILRNNVGFMGTFSEGYAVIGSRGYENKVWFVINKKGEKVFDLPDGYEPAMADIGEYKKIKFDNGRLMIQKGEWYSRKVAIVDTQGNIIKTFEDATSASQFDNGIAIVAKNYVPMFIDINGNVISQSVKISQSGGDWMNFSEELSWYRDETTGKYGYIDTKCNVVIHPKYINCQDFSDGLAAVQDNNELWGFIDKTGKYIIEPMFTNMPSSFCSGYAKVKDKAGQVHFIDKAGKIVWTPENGDQWYNFTNNGQLIGKTSILNTSFKQIVQYKSNLFMGGNLLQYNDDWFVMSEPDTPKSQVFDYNGNLLLNCRVNAPFNNDIAGCLDSDEPYYFNIKGEIIIIFNDTQF